MSRFYSEARDVFFHNQSRTLSLAVECKFSNILRIYQQIFLHVENLLISYYIDYFILSNLSSRNNTHLASSMSRSSKLSGELTSLLSALSAEPSELRINPLAARKLQDEMYIY